MTLGFWNLWLLKIHFVSYFLSHKTQAQIFLHCTEMIPPLFIPDQNVSIIETMPRKCYLCYFGILGQEFRSCVNTHRSCDSARVRQRRQQALDYASVFDYLHADTSALI